MGPKHRLSGDENGPHKRQAANEPQFRHEPLKRDNEQLRLLKMLPSDGEDDAALLTFEISVHELDGIVPFYAISYTWGEPTEQSTIIINGRPFLVFQNCLAVLRQVVAHHGRGNLQHGYVWIDSVCIDQVNIEEKKSQVSIMGDVYARAATVLAYLGTHSEEDDSSFLWEHVRDTMDFSSHCTQAESLCDECQKPWTDWILSLGYPCLNRLTIACTKFGNRGYWKRVWIIQETAKATTLSILCGDDVLPWESLYNFEQFLAMDMEDIPGIFDAYPRYMECEPSSMRDVLTMRGESAAISTILNRFSGSMCKDPRDRVYGLLSLFDWPDGTSPIMPDYEISPFRLIEKVARYVFLGELRDTLALFDVNARNADVEQAAAQRRTLFDGSGDSQSLGSFDMGFKPLPTSDQDEGERLDMSACVVITEDEKQMTTTALIRCDSEEPLFSSSSSDVTQDSETGSTGSGSADIESEVSGDEMDGVTSELVESILNDFAQDRPERLMLGSEIAGYMSKGTRKDDILVPLPAKTSGALLILRSSHGDLYDIVGQAILLPAFQLGVSSDLPPGTIQPDIFEARIEVRLSPEDAALLFAQDMGTSEFSVNPRGRCLRILTPVTLRPNEAARLTSRSPLSVSKARKRFGLGALQRRSVPPASASAHPFSQLQSGRWEVGPA